MMMKGLGLDESMSNLTSTVSGETSISSNTRNESSSTATNTNGNAMLYPQASSSSFASPNQAQPPPLQSPPAKKKRNLPGNPDPDAEVIALSPKSLLATNRFICEICNKGFQRDQNLQLHRRGHNLPWKLKQRSKDQIRKKVYVCPEPTCVHHDPSRALGDLTGIKKHFCRKHGEKKWKCEKCSKKYAVQSDWKAHSKICGTREYRCDCGTLFSRRDSFITHRAFCDALAEERARAINPLNLPSIPQVATPGGSSTTLPHLSLPHHLSHHHHALQSLPLKREQDQHLSFGSRPEIPPWLACPPPPQQHQHPQQGSLAAPSQMFSFQAHQYDNDHNNNHSHTQHEPSPSLDHAGPTLSSFQAPPPPQMSATALLQKAAEMGVTVSNQQQHHQHQQHHELMSSHGLMVNNKQQPHNAHMSAGLCSSREGNQHTQHHHHHQSVMTNNTGGFIEGQVVVSSGAPSSSSGGGGPQSSMLHDMMIMSSLQSTATGSAFDNPGFVDFHHNHQGMAASKPPSLDGGATTGGAAGGGGGGDGMTRDFLGLRTFSHKDFLNMAGLGHMSSSSSASFDQQHDHNQNQTPW